MDFLKQTPSKSPTNAEDFLATTTTTITTNVQGNSFYEDPCRLWDGPLIVGWAARHAKDMITVEKHLTQARASAVTQTTIPAVTAADQVSIVLEPDEGEYQGATTAAHPDRPSHGGRAKFAKRG